MDLRTNFIQQLHRYTPADAAEQISRDEILEFVRSHPRCFENDCLPGHITGSALVVDETFEYTLLTHHRKLGLWVQFGGHSDGHPDPIKTALREAQEESGLMNLSFLPGYYEIFDLDVHAIPAREHTPAHTHYDIRILLTTIRNSRFTVSHESKELRWIALTSAAQYNHQPAFLRMINKVISLQR